MSGHALAEFWQLFQRISRCRDPVVALLARRHTPCVNNPRQTHTRDRGCIMHHLALASEVSFGPSGNSGQHTTGNRLAQSRGIGQYSLIKCLPPAETGSRRCPGGGDEAKEGEQGAALNSTGAGFSTVRSPCGLTLPLCPTWPLWELLGCHFALICPGEPARAGVVVPRGPVTSAATTERGSSPPLLCFLGSVLQSCASFLFCLILL